MSARKFRRHLRVHPLEDRVTPTVLLNELYVNPPGPDDNREYVEIRSTTGGVEPLSGLALVEINGNPTAAGVIDSDKRLTGLSTGANGLLVLGPNYATLGTPWGSLIPAGAALGDKNNSMSNDNLSVLLVTGYTGITGQDLDLNDDGVLDVTPWTSILDSVGWLDPSVVGGRVYSSAVLTQPSLTPDAASRFANNSTPNSTAGWYNGEMLAQGGVPDLTRWYNPAIASSNLPSNAVITPGDVNMSASVPPRIVSTIVNDGSAQRSRVTSLTVTFSTEVSFASGVASAFSLVRSGGGAVNFTATAAIVGGVTVVTIGNFTGLETNFGSLRDGRFALTANAAQISANTLPLDGNSDGVGGDDYTFGDAQGLFRFFGDVNGDRRVDIADFAQLSSSFGRNAGQPGFLSYLDWNGDGRVDIVDFGQFAIRYFTTLP